MKVLKKIGCFCLHVVLTPWYCFIAIRSFRAKPMRKLLDDPEW
jgi:hypothetical protein